MWFEVDFGRPVSLDSVLIRAVADQEFARIVLEGQSPDGTWRLLNNSPQVFELDPPLELRRMAAQELLARGIRYILIANDDIGIEDFVNRANLWGIRLAGQESGTFLFEIKTPQK
jgi:hypothetical protein